uniref:IkappaB kinase n=1 Tax=Pristionchus pacificus TaxID=54126 RepID=A0A2A6CD05_PRIPA|eukprot:PDM76082.1 protein kinase [Pristionchus pacificus]
MSDQLRENLDYECLRSFSSGAFGKVHHGYLYSTGEAVVIKKGKKKDLKGEYELLKQLSSTGVGRTHVVRVFGYTDNSPHLNHGDFNIIMERAQCSLDILLQRASFRAGLPAVDIIQLVADLGIVLAFLLEKQVAHRDIKPQNILVFSGANDPAKSQFMFKLCDFGAARETIGEESECHTIVGTVPFLNPEILLELREHPQQYRTNQPYRAEKCDLWSLGVTIYNAATARLPWPGTGAHPDDVRALHENRRGAIAALPLAHGPGYKYYDTIRADSYPRWLRHALSSLIRSQFTNASYKTFLAQAAYIAGVGGAKEMPAGRRGTQKRLVLLPSLTPSMHAEVDERVFPGASIQLHGLYGLPLTTRTAILTADGITVYGPGQPIALDSFADTTALVWNDQSTGFGPEKGTVDSHYPATKEIIRLPHIESVEIPIRSCLTDSRRKWMETKFRLEIGRLSTKVTIRVFFPDDGQCVFLSNPADPSRHRCGEMDQRVMTSADPQSFFVPRLREKDFSKQNSESAADGHLKNPSRAYRECSALIAKREGLANLLLPEDVDEVLDLYSGGKNKNKRKRQLSLDVKKSAGVSRVEEYDAIDDNDIQVIGQSETFRISDPDDSKRIYLAARRTFELAIELGIEALLIDGNFGFTPIPTCTKKRAYQLFTVRVCCRNTSFLLVAALLPSKAASEYTLLLETVQTIFSNMNFSLKGVRIVSDWETGIIKAVRTAIPMARHEGCSFHALKCINNKISSFGLNAFAKSYPVVRTWFNRVRAAIFLPKTYIEQSEWMTHPETMFCKFMIERHRTTNLVESWHRGLISYFLVYPPPPTPCSREELLQRDVLLCFNLDRQCEEVIDAHRLAASITKRNADRVIARTHELRQWLHSIERNEKHAASTAAVAALMQSRNQDMLDRLQSCPGETAMRRKEVERCAAEAARLAQCAAAWTGMDERHIANWQDSLRRLSSPSKSSDTRSALEMDQKWAATMLKRVQDRLADLKTDANYRVKKEEGIGHVIRGIIALETTLHECVRKMRETAGVVSAVADQARDSISSYMQNTAGLDEAQIRKNLTNSVSAVSMLRANVEKQAELARKMEELRVRFRAQGVVCATLKSKQAVNGVNGTAANGLPPRPVQQPTVINCNQTLESEDMDTITPARSGFH